MTEHDAHGIEFPAPSEPVSRFREAAEVVDRLLHQERTSYAGQYYRLTDAVCQPQPVQEPRPPLMLASHGRRHGRVAA